MKGQLIITFTPFPTSALLVLLLVASGCGSGGEATANGQAESPRSEATRTATYSSEWTAETQDGVSIEVKPLEPLKMERASERELYREKDPGAGFCIDQKTGKIAWRALTCGSPNCSGRNDGAPHVFIQPAENAPLKADGSIDLDEWDRIAVNHFYSLKCPICEAKKVVPYDPPEVVERRQLLHDQLAAARAERRKAREAGQPLPTGVRSPSDIMRDLSALPKLFLAEP